LANIENLTKNKKFDLKDYYLKTVKKSDLKENFNKAKIPKDLYAE
jgi:hypothetical protein